MSTQEVKHWIVVNWDRRCIWKKPFLLLSDAQKELKALLDNNLKSGWVIEEQKGWKEMEEIDEIAKGISDF